MLVGWISNCMSDTGNYFSSVPVSNGESMLVLFLTIPMIVPQP